MTARRQGRRSRGRERPGDSPWADVVVAVIRDGGRVLVTRRPAAAHLGGFDEFPGGRREAGETIEAACVREVAEETGLAVRVGRRLAVAWHRDAQRRLALTFLECSCDDPAKLDATAVAGRGARWVELRALDELRFPPANRDVVRRLIGDAGGAMPPAVPEA